MINALFKFEDLDAEFTAYLAYDEIYILVQIGDEQNIIKTTYAYESTQYLNYCYHDNEFG